MPRLPDRAGHFGAFGGRYVAETLMPALLELERRIALAARRVFKRELRDVSARLRRPPDAAVLRARDSPSKLGGAQIYLKREDLCHTGAHKINNTLGQALLARRMGKRRIIAETGAGQHGVATATVAALFGFECEVYMGERGRASARRSTSSA